MRLGSNGPNIHQPQCRVRGRLNPNQLCLGGDVFSDVDFDFWCEGDLDTVCLCDLGELSVCATIDIAHTDDMTTRCQTLQDDGSSRRP